MASRTDETLRTVIPNWNDFKTTSQSGELMGNNREYVKLSLFPIDHYISAWNEQHNLAFAGDLLSAAIMNKQVEHASVLEAATFIIERSEDCPSTLLKTAQAIVKQHTFNIDNYSYLSDSVKLDSILDRESVVKENIRFLRKLIKRFQFNPIWYVELSRAYATLGLLKKAEWAMSVALHLSPESRFVTRSASRLYLHIGDIDHAHYVVVNSPFLKYDPWLLASEIAINASRGRSSRFIKHGLAIINSSNYSPFSITELSSALGTKELNSSIKKGKILLAKSLIQPNDNSLAQADWLMNADKSLDLDFSCIKKSDINFESDARYAFLKGEYQRAFSCSIDWLSSAPFAKSAINFAADMAYTYQHNYQDAAKILQIGLMGNPHELSFLNNLAYAYALDNQTDKADKILDQLLPLASNENELNICSMATQGLNEYRKGNPKLGSSLYLRAIDEAKKNGKINLAQKAILNNIREEVRISPQQDKSHIFDIINKLNTGNPRETEAMRREIMSYMVD